MAGEAPLILLVEQDAILASITSLRLELLGYRVFLVPDYRRAYEEAVRLEPQLIIVDAAATGGEHLSLLNQLSSEPATSDIPLLLFSESADLDDVEQAYAAGAQEYVVKPYDPVVLEEKVDRLLRRDAARA